MDRLPLGARLGAKRNKVIQLRLIAAACRLKGLAERTALGEQLP